MVISKIELNNFRNYESLVLNFDYGTNILYGDNAQGKTNILEACYLSGTTKSHKGSKDRELIKFGSEEAHIRTTVLKNEKEYRIDIHLKKNKTKGIAVNKIPLKKASDLFGYLNVIFFSPEDLNIIKNGPAERRRFIDSELCQIDKIYLSDLTNYNKVLNQRNKLLKDIYFNPSLKDTLPVWDEQLINYGKKIIKRRRSFIEELAGVVKNIHLNISGGKEHIEMLYEPCIEDIFFEDELIRSHEKDIKTAMTNVGPHRDDINFLIDGVDIRRYGSQGQQRTCALSLKLSEIEIVKNKIGENPVLLLDDVLSELDHQRQDYLLGSIKETQTIITCTGVDDFIINHFDKNKVFEVVNGSVHDKNGNDGE